MFATTLFTFISCSNSIQDQEERDATKAKVDKKMEKRAMKKELKKDLGVDKCKQQ